MLHDGIAGKMRVSDVPRADKFGQIAGGLEHNAVVKHFI